VKIIGIALDLNKADWQKAIIEHQVEIWPQISSAYILENYFRNEKDAQILKE